MSEGHVEKIKGDWWKGPVLAALMAVAAWGVNSKFDAMNAKIDSTSAATIVEVKATNTKLDEIVKAFQGQEVRIVKVETKMDASGAQSPSADLLPRHVYQGTSSHSHAAGIAHRHD